MADKSSSKYGVQPAYNESFAPSCPPTYDEAVGLAPTGVNSNQLLPGHGIQQPVQGVYYAPPVQPPVQVVPQIVPVPVSVGARPAHIKCPNCNNQVKTRINTSYQKSAHIACFLLCVFGCCLCSCIPYCMRSFKTVHHTCPTCKVFIGSFKN